MKRPGGGLGNILGMIGKKNKMSTLVSVVSDNYTQVIVVLLYSHSLLLSSNLVGPVQFGLWV